MRVGEGTRRSGAGRAARHWARGVLLPLCVVWLGSGCAAIFTGTSADVHFTSAPPGGTVTVKDQVHALPATVKVSKRTKEVTFSHPDHPDQVLDLDKSFQWGFLLMDILFTPGFGLSGILIDSATNAWNKLPSHVACDFHARAVAATKRVGEEPPERSGPTSASR